MTYDEPSILEEYDEDADVYVPSVCIQAALEIEYPAHITPEHPLFEQRMKALQARMLRCHLPSMHSSTRRRALRTLRALRTGDVW